MDLIGQAVLLAGGIHCSSTLDLNFHESFLSSWRLAICVLAPFMEGLATSAERLICDVWAIFVGASIAASSQPSLPCLRHKWASARWGWIIWVTAFQLFHNLLTKAPVCSKNHPKLPKVPTTAWASMLFGWEASNLSTIGCIVTCSWCKALKEYNGSKGQFWIWDNSNKELYEKFNSCAQVQKFESR